MFARCLAIKWLVWFGLTASTFSVSADEPRIGIEGEWRLPGLFGKPPTTEPFGSKVIELKDGMVLKWLPVDPAISLISPGIHSERDVCRYSVVPDRQPSEIDFIWKDQRIEGIYKIEGNRLTVVTGCNERPTSFEIDGRRDWIKTVYFRGGEATEIDGRWRRVSESLGDSEGKKAGYAGQFVRRSSPIVFERGVEMSELLGFVFALPYELRPDKSPAEIDFEDSLGIYRLERDRLWICSSPHERPTSFNTKGHPDWNCTEWVRDEEKADRDWALLAGGWVVSRNINGPRIAKFERVTFYSPRRYDNAGVCLLSAKSKNEEWKKVASLQSVRLDSSKAPSTLSCVFSTGEGVKKKSINLSGLYELNGDKLVITLGPERSPPERVKLIKGDTFWQLELVKAAK